MVSFKKLVKVSVPPPLYEDPLPYQPYFHPLFIIYWTTPFEEGQEQSSLPPPLKKGKEAGGKGSELC